MKLAWRPRGTTGKEYSMNKSLLMGSHGPVAPLTLNRPAKLNALNGELIGALMAALDEIELDRSVRTIVVTGAGRAFSADARLRRTMGPKQSRAAGASGPGLLRFARN